LEADVLHGDYPDLKPILVIDDDPDLREVIEQLLQLEGYQVVTAENGQAALEQLAHGDGDRPGLILLDLMMPVMDGWEFRHRQADDPRIASIPVIVLSAAHNGQQKARNLGVAGFMQKPVEFDRLIETAHQYCA
jgi:CheY-like chemotaxis protein